MQYQEEQDYTKRFDIGIWKKLLHYAKPFYKHLIAILLIMCVTGVLDVIFPLLNREAIDSFARTGTVENLGFFCFK